MIDAAPTRTIQFARRRWSVRRTPVATGPGPNVFDDSPETVRVDASGRLVLQIHRPGDTWVCAEVIGEELLGPGRFEWSLPPGLAALDPVAVLGLFAYDEKSPPLHREIDVEVSAWDRPADVGGLFAVQPAATNQHAFPVPPTAWRTGFDWSPARVAFTASGGASWTCSSSAVPATGPVQPRINLWLYDGAPPRLGLLVAVTIDDFRYTPLGG